MRASDRNINIIAANENFVPSQGQRKFLTRYINKCRREIGVTLGANFDDVALKVTIRREQKYQFDYVSGSAVEYCKNKGQSIRPPVEISPSLRSISSLVSNPFCIKIKSTLAHELHHAQRTNNGPGDGKSIGEDFVFEGLAMCFEEEVARLEPWFFETLNNVKSIGFAERMIPEFASPWVPNDPRLHGDENNYNEYPFACGYALGYIIVSEWLSAQQEKKASRHYAADASTILTWWVDNRNKSPFSKHESAGLEHCVGPSQKPVIWVMAAGKVSAGRQAGL